MAWQEELTIITRTLINDWCSLNSNPEYTDGRIQQLITVAAKYVVKDVNLTKNYNIDVVNIDIIPDPTDPAGRDDDFITFVCLKAACMLDQSTFRTKAAMEGIKTSLGSASLSVGGNLAGYKTILDSGPCALYDSLVMSYNVGEATAVRAILSPFVGNNFDPRYLLRGSNRGSNGNDLYS
jgi:hypothetical protein